MRNDIIKAVVAAALLAGPIIAVADDSVITTKIKARLAAEHLTSIARIHVDSDANGVVYLSGTAQSQDAIDTAIRLARDTEHVRDVHSDLTVHQDN
ncbi:MAG TPA: BON domain-containing protein [Steroidobacteraceae bacterium]|jgi:hyperosmotically inducible protein|nr:BON domain-containing protein [Steroidobacteraceae bacterium]